MKSVPCAILVAVFAQLAFAAPPPSSNKTMFDTVRMEQSVSVGDMDQFIVVFGVSPCMASCLESLNKGFNDTESESDEEKDPKAKFIATCDNYLAAAACFRKCPDGDDHLFDVISSGANFMCVEQRDAFERAMPCIYEQRKALKKECRQKCDIPEDIETEHQSSRAPQTPSQSGNSSEFFAHVGELCDMLHCSIECGRDFLNEHCDKDLHAGSLLTEVIIRPLEKNAEYMQEMSPDFEESVHQALPKTCFFIVDTKELNELRGGWSFEDKNVRPKESNSVTKFPATSFTKDFRTTKGFQTTRDLQNIRQRRSYSSSNLIASSGVFATHAMTHFM